MAILVHRMMLGTDAGELILARQFYTGHSYNANQLFIVCLPHREGSLVFSTNRIFTDQAAGFGSHLKHAIDGKKAQGEMTKMLKNIRNNFK